VKAVIQKLLTHKEASSLFTGLMAIPNGLGHTSGRMWTLQVILMIPIMNVHPSFENSIRSDRTRRGTAAFGKKHIGPEIYFRGLSRRLGF